MSKTEKTRPRRQPGTGQAETTAFGGAVISCNHFITGGVGRQPGFIERLLSHGAKNGLTLRDLIALTGWHERDIRAEIQRERLSGVPILSDNSNGYYLPADDQERYEFVKSMKHRAGEIVRVAEAVQRAGD